MYKEENSNKKLELSRKEMERSKELLKSIYENRINKLKNNKKN